MQRTANPAYNQLLDDWRQATREHAADLQERTRIALRLGVNDTPLIADQITLPGADVEGDEGTIVSRDRILPGPWVRVYDATANHGNGSYAWAKGRTVINDHAIEGVTYQGAEWAEIQQLSAAWPARPCTESYSESPAGEDDPQSYPAESEYNWCPGCDKLAALVRYNDVWERPAHTIDGKLIDPLA